MKIEVVACGGNRKNLLAEVGSLNYDFDKGVFWMNLCMGDDWLQKISSPPELKPSGIGVNQYWMRVSFESDNDAQGFYDWLVEAEAQVQHGFRTMRG